MARTAYQKQADTRTRKALSLRAKYDARIRKYAQALITAIGGAMDAKSRLDRINQLYGVDLSTETLLAHSVRVGDFGPQLGTLLNESTPGEEVQLFNPTPNGNGGVALAPELLFGESLPPIGLPPVLDATPTKPAPSFTNTLSATANSAAGVTLAAQAGDTLAFTALADGGAAPVSMDLYRNGQQVAGVVYFDRYTGKPFRFEDNTGAYTSAFAPGKVNL
ncbi:hypothetical protein [Hymenobacter latericus]|uniref:hypothetical protein n=1 Tax=Hymenobacter sp. YIM 151858-1 TaxID=2987688 RepID=UPI002226311D|nr:hypothetical protein [Hymenobacter sp. YIM 151858-1]UYZ60192.1 hypothetical protein OIS50_05175 [Hymenobacter sp. YIM 151858-1]